jgi:hypothetical protein
MNQKNQSSYKSPWLTKSIGGAVDQSTKQSESQLTKTKRDQPT